MSKRWSIAPGERLRDVSQRMRKTDIQIWVILGLIAVIFVGMSAAVPNYASLLNLKIMLGNYVLEGIMALGMTLVIISGGIDLSVAGVMPFTAILFAYMLKGGIPIPAAMADSSDGGRHWILQ